MTTVEDLQQKIAHFNMPMDGSAFTMIVRSMTHETALLYWSEYGGALFWLSEDSSLSDLPPEIYPMERLEKIHYDKRLLTNDGLQFEIENEKVSLIIPHRTKLFTQQKEALRKMRHYFE